MCISLELRLVSDLGDACVFCPPFEFILRICPPLRRISKAQHTDNLTQTEIRITCIRVKAREGPTLSPGLHRPIKLQPPSTTTPLAAHRSTLSDVLRTRLFFSTLRIVRHGASNEYDFRFSSKDHDSQRIATSSFSDKGVDWRESASPINLARSSYLCHFLTI